MPIRFTNEAGRGQIATIEDGSDEYYATLLGNCLRIEPSELPISTFFGTLDPSFATSTPLRTVQNAARFVPEISITDVTSKTENDGSLGLNITFTVKG